MGTYGQYCPISRAADLLGDRWSLLILRDMVGGCTRFNELSRTNPRISRSLLSRRLNQLQQQGLIEHVDDGTYRLTQAGKDVEHVLISLATWGARWSFGEPQPEELDPDLLLWWMHHNVDMEALPAERFVFHIHLTDHRRRYWIVVDGAPSICAADPGFPVDVTVRASRAALYTVHLGRERLQDAVAAGSIVLEGSPTARRTALQALRPSMVAPIVENVLVGSAE